MELQTACFFIITCVLGGIIWSFYNWKRVENSGNQQDFKAIHFTDDEVVYIKQEEMIKVREIGGLIRDGAKAFLYQEYKYCIIFCVLFSILIFGASDQFKNLYTTIPFLIGSFTSIVSGYISMMIATSSNSKTAAACVTSLNDGFKVAFRAGCSMGFLLVSIGLGVLVLLILVSFSLRCANQFCLSADGEISLLSQLFDGIAGFGLGGSTVALFGRVGGGIYTKAADVGADLVGKIVHELEQDSPMNPATIADNVGDNVGDVAGMGADLFGSFAESTCAALVISSASLVDTITAPTTAFPSINNLFFPLMITAVGIVVCFLTSLKGAYFTTITHSSIIQSTLKKQLFFSSLLLTPAVYAMALYTLPSEFSLRGMDEEQALHTPSQAWVCVTIGLWTGLIVGYFTEYMTSYTYKPVKELAYACVEGPAINIIYGLSLGYLSTIVPVIAIAITSFASLYILGFYGVSLAAIGMLSNLPISLAIDGYGPISDNAGGIAQMAQLGKQIRERTDALDAAGNTTAAIGQGFAIGSAALVALSLYGGFVTRVIEWTAVVQSQENESQEIHGFPNGIQDIALIDPIVFASLLIGSMLPYAFSAFTMKSVGKAAKEMVKEVQGQIKRNPGILNGTIRPDYEACIKISTQASLKQMVRPALLVILTPLGMGVLFGPKSIAGLLPGALLSGIQLATSASNTGGAWDNAQQFIEAGNLRDQYGDVYRQKSDPHQAAVIGDTVGDPLKDTSGPSLNILIKLMAILSLIFAEFFCETGWVIGTIGQI